MARIRTIKPEFFTSEDVVSLSFPARLLYIALWCEADREGRMSWKPKTFKMRYFPGDRVDIDALCKELLKSGLVVLYGDGLAHIPMFLKHQHINPRESASTLPVPPDCNGESQSSRVTDDENTRADASVTHREEGKGKEGKGKEIKACPFDLFWAAYPKKEDKKNAAKKWEAAELDGKAEMIIADVKRRTTEHRPWVEGFVPHPTTYLNGERWNDDFEAPRKAPAREPTEFELRAQSAK